MGTFIDITGQKFGRLTVIKYLGKSHWLCKCDCGKETDVFVGHLKAGHTKSCGCLYLEVRNKGANLKHGLKGDRLYALWKKIKQRCYSTTFKRYNDWGGRGIKMYEPWINNPKSFCDYVSKLPNCGERGRSLDRIDNDGNYEPHNLRWATAKEQSNNRRPKGVKNETTRK